MTSSRKPNKKSSSQIYRKRRVENRSSCGSRERDKKKRGKEKKERSTRKKWISSSETQKGRVLSRRLGREEEGEAMCLCANYCFEKQNLTAWGREKTRASASGSRCELLPKGGSQTRLNSASKRQRKGRAFCSETGTLRWSR